MYHSQGNGGDNERTFPCPVRSPFRKDRPSGSMGHGTFEEGFLLLLLLLLCTGAARTDSSM